MNERHYEDEQRWRRPEDRGEWQFGRRGEHWRDQGDGRYTTSERRFDRDLDREDRWGSERERFDGRPWQQESDRSFRGPRESYAGNGGNQEPWFSGSRMDRGYGSGNGQYGQYADSRTGEESRGFIGRGPKGYHRSDDRIREEISDRLTDDWSIDASDIEIRVQDGNVTLTGTVSDRSQKRRAEDLAESISGASDVTNNIRVEKQQEGSRTASAGVTGTQTSSHATSKKGAGADATA